MYLNRPLHYSRENPCEPSLSEILEAGKKKKSTFSFILIRACSSKKGNQEREYFGTGLSISHM